jgi:hypothetical protein
MPARRDRLTTAHAGKGSGALVRYLPVPHRNRLEQKAVIHVLKRNTL